MRQQDAHVGVVTRGTRYKKGKVDKTFFRFVLELGDEIDEMRLILLLKKTLLKK